MSIKLQGIDKIMAKLEKHKLLVHGTITSTKRAVVQSVLEDLVRHSPQWSGNLAQQWYVETTGYSGGYHPKRTYISPEDDGPGDVEPYQMGDDPAVSYTLRREAKRIASIRWNSKVQIVNHAPYAAEVEEGKGPGNTQIRQENRLASYGGVAMVGYVTTKYNNLRYIKGKVL